MTTTGLLAMILCLAREAGFGVIYTQDQGDRASSGGSSMNATSKSTRSVPSTCNSDVQLQRMSLLDSILQGELPCDLEKSYNILALLRVLEGLNQLAPRLRGKIIVDNFAEGKISNLDELSVTGARVPAEDFVNSKLTPKLSWQIQDALALCSVVYHHGASN